MSPHPYVIGLTGNIATGKSTVACMLAVLGACVIDADRLTHQTMRPGGPAYGPIVTRFGAAVVDADHEIDRQRLGAIVFSDAAALADLEALVHPFVVQETLRLLAECACPVAVVEAIKLLEAQMHAHCHAVWVVTCARDQQVRRLMETRGLSAAEAELRIAAQPDAQLKLARANCVIDNSGGLEETWQQVVAAWNAIPGICPAPIGRSWACAECQGA